MQHQNQSGISRFKLLTAGSCAPLLLAPVLCVSNSVLPTLAEPKNESDHVVTDDARPKGQRQATALTNKTVQRDAQRQCSHCHLNLLRRKETHCANCRLSISSKRLIAKSKLSLGAWQQFCAALGVPPEPNNLTAKQARAARQLLDIFVANHPIAAQVVLRDYEIKNWLREFLPANLDSCLKVFGIVGNCKILADSDELSTINNTADQQQTNDNRVDFGANERKPVSANLFVEVAARQGSYCFWCGVKVVRESHIPPANRIVKNKTTVVYLANGELREEAIGTVDHLLRVTDSGDNNPANLVISCLVCNHERDREARAYNRPFARRRTPCHSCGARFFHPDWGCCSICGAPAQRCANCTFPTIIRRLVASAQNFVRARFSVSRFW